jgi:hypothetical protein
MNCTVFNDALYYEKTYINEAILFFTIFNTVYLYYTNRNITKTGLLILNGTSSMSPASMSTAASMSKSNSPPDYQ